MPFIVLCSIIALAICIERQFALNRKKIAPPHLLATVWQQLHGEGFEAQRLKSRRQGSPSGATLAAGLANQRQEPDVMRETIQGAASHAIDQLERLTIATGSTKDD